MSSAILEPVPAPPPPPEPVRRLHYLNVATGVTSWLLTRDHKRIAILYLLTITTMFVLGSVAIGIVRLPMLSESRPGRVSGLAELYVVTPA